MRATSSRQPVNRTASPEPRRQRFEPRALGAVADDREAQPVPARPRRGEEEPVERLFRREATDGDEADHGRGAPRGRARGRGKGGGIEDDVRRGDGAEAPFRSPRDLGAAGDDAGREPPDERRLEAAAKRRPEARALLEKVDAGQKGEPPPPRRRGIPGRWGRACGHARDRRPGRGARLRAGPPASGRRSCARERRRPARRPPRGGGGGADGCPPRSAATAVATPASRPSSAKSAASSWTPPQARLGRICATVMEGGLMRRAREAPGSAGSCASSPRSRRHRGTRPRSRW